MDFWVRNASNDTGTPKLYTIEGDFIVPSPTPSGTFKAQAAFYERDVALSDDSDTNTLLSSVIGQRNILLYASLLEAAPFLGDDPRTLMWSALYDDMIEKLHSSDKMDRYPAGSIASRSDVNGG